MSIPTIPLRYAADVIVSNVDKKSSSGEKPIRLVNYTDVYYQDRITPDLALMPATATLEQVARFTLREGDSIITKDSETADDIAVPAYVAGSEPDMVCGYHLAIIRPHIAIESRYLYWALRSDFIRTQFTVGAKGMTRYGLSYDAIGSAEVPVPEHAVQRHVADFLDDQVTRIDGIHAARDAQMASIHEVTRRLRSDTLSGNSTTAIEHPILGSVNSAWQIKRLREVVRRIGVGVVVNPSSYFAEDGVPFIHGSNVREGRIDLTGVKRIPQQQSDMLWRSRLSATDVVVVRAGYPGRAAVVPATLEGANCASILLIKTASSALPHWIELFFNSPQGRSQVGLVQYGAAQEQINVSDVVDFVLPVPPVGVQRSQLDSYFECMNSLEQLVTAIERQKVRLRELKQSLITAAVQGTFGVSSADGSRVPV